MNEPNAQKKQIFERRTRILYVYANVWRRVAAKESGDPKIFLLVRLRCYNFFVTIRKKILASQVEFVRPNKTQNLKKNYQKKRFLYFQMEQRGMEK